MADNIINFVIFAAVLAFVFYITRKDKEDEL